MRTFLASTITLAGFAACLAACSTDLDETTPPTTQQAEQPIVNGSADTTTGAAVFVYSETGGCTGALFKVDRSRDLAWVLTAAHCVLNQQQTQLVVPQGVVITKDYATDPDSIFIEAVRATYDQRYNSSDQYDFAVVTLRGIPDDAVLPPLLELTGASDGLATGQTVTSIGFGVTNAAGTQENSRRNRISKPIAALNSIDITYNQSQSGICYGDSGGPVISQSGKVVGVHSRVGQSGSGPCNGTGISARLTGALSWVNGVVSSDQSSPPAGISECDRCSRNADYGDTVCRQKRDACQSNADCRSVLDCLADARTQSAQTACINSKPNAAGAIYDYYSCACLDLCTDVCQSDSNCQGWAANKCGAINYGDVKECAEANCCEEMDAVSADPQGYGCMTGSITSGCEGNSKVQAIYSCMEDACGGIDGTSSSGGKSSSSSGGRSSSGDGDGDDDDNGDGDENGSSSSSGSSKKKKSDEGGCTVASVGANGSAFPGGAGALLGLGLIAAARRKRHAR